MTYTDLLRRLFQSGFTRVERDDRLLDVFPAESREKGVELWENWQPKTVKILRVRLPFNAKKLQMFAISRAELEKLLQTNKKAELRKFTTTPF